MKCVECNQEKPGGVLRYSKVMVTHKGSKDKHFWGHINDLSKMVTEVINAEIGQAVLHGDVKLLKAAHKAKPTAPMIIMGRPDLVLEMLADRDKRIDGWEAASEFVCQACHEEANKLYSDCCNEEALPSKVMRLGPNQPSHYCTKCSKPCKTHKREASHEK